MTAVYGETGEDATDALHELAEACALTPEKARAIVRSTIRAAQQCGSIAKKNGCKQSEIKLLAAAVESRCDALARAFGI